MTLQLNIRSKPPLHEMEHEVSTNIPRRTIFKGGLALAGLGLVSSVTACSPPGGGSSGGGNGPIKIGGLIPLTGMETHNGLSMKYALEIAAEEVNAAGGLSARQVELVIRDTASDVDKGVQAAEELIDRESVEVLIGTLLSSVRAAVFDVAKRSNTLFMNPTYYEGGLCSPNFFSTGATPNQGIDPLAKWAVENVGKNVYFIGSDYSWGTGSIDAAKRAWEAAGGTVVGSPELVPFGVTDYSSQIRSIQAATPDIVWPFVAGTDGITFLKQLGDAGVRDDVDIVATYLDELMIPALTRDIYEGIINCSPYYMALDNAENQEFLATMRSKYGEDALMGSFGMNMYNNLKILALAADGMDTWDPVGVRENLTKVSFDGPSGLVKFDSGNHHATTSAYIAEVNSTGDFDLLESIEAVVPDAHCSI